MENGHTWADIFPKEVFRPLMSLKTSWFLIPAVQKSRGYMMCIIITNIMAMVKVEDALRLKWVVVMAQDGNLNMPAC